MNQEQKLINWSYPTSDNSKKAVMYNTGCYSVESVPFINGQQQPPKFIKGFRTLQDARNFADTLPNAYNRHSL